VYIPEEWEVQEYLILRSQHHQKGFEGEAKEDESTLNAVACTQAPAKAIIMVVRVYQLQESLRLTSYPTAKSELGSS
jgi:hypothetical protein